jgi:hypothetical protein
MLAICSYVRFQRAKNSAVGEDLEKREDCSAMKFCVCYQQPSNQGHSPFRVVEQTTGRGVGWINRYLDREYVRRLANTTLRT